MNEKTLRISGSDINAMSQIKTQKAVQIAKDYQEDAFTKKPKQVQSSLMVNENEEKNYYWDTIMNTRCR